MDLGKTMLIFLSVFPRCRFQWRTFAHNRTNFPQPFDVTFLSYNLAGRNHSWLTALHSNLAGLMHLGFALSPSVVIINQFCQIFRSCAMPKRDRRDQSQSPVATRPKAAPQTRHDHWSHRDTSRQHEIGRRNEPFNAFPQTTVRSRDHSPHTDESTGQHKVILRSNSEIRRDRHHRSDLTSWKQLTMPNMDTAQLPEWARPPPQDLVLPSSHIPEAQSAPSSTTQNLTMAPPLSILLRSDCPRTWRTTRIRKAMVLRCHSSR